MAFDPKRDGWSLRDAIMRTSNPMLLPSVAQKRLELGSQPWWWVPKLAPEPLLKRRIEYHIDPEQDYELTVKALETAFRIKLVRAELVCWAQPATTDAKYIKLNASAWWALVVDDWWGDTLIEGTRDEHREFVPVVGGARYYGARIEKPGLRLTKPNKGGRPVKAYKAPVTQETIDWLDQEGEMPLPAIKEYMANLCAKHDPEGGPGRNTLTSWAKDALAKYREMRERS